MIISIITKNPISEKEINNMIKYYAGMVVVPISKYHIVVRDVNVYDVNNCTNYYSYSVTSIAKYLRSVPAFNELAA